MVRVDGGQRIPRRFPVAEWFPALPRLCRRLNLI
jgi:hypothetical protein